MRDLDVVGVGYQGLALPALIAELHRLRVTTLADVRLTPLSRKPGLSKHRLAAALDAAGIAYRHLPALGNQKDNRAGFGGSAAELRTARSIFGRRLDTEPARQALDELATLATAGPVALLCFEADEQRCHRAVVLDRLRAREPALTAAG